MALEYYCAIKTIEMFNFLPLIKNSVTTGFSFLLLIISAITSSKTIILRFLPILYFSIFLKTSCKSFEYSIKALGSLKHFNAILSLLLIKN